MRYQVLVLLGCVLLLAGCGDKPLPPVEFMPPAQPVSYDDEIRPILNARCVVCHSCYNSPCQLKLSSYEGLDRGASKKAIYNAERLKTMDPTRLFVDAQTTQQWRKKDFFSVTENSLEECKDTSSENCSKNNSIMLQLLSHKFDHPMKDRDIFNPEASDLTCSESDAKLGTFLRKHPNRGMPFGFPPLTRLEFEKIAGWIVQGAPGPDRLQREKALRIPEIDSVEIKLWEDFLNDSHTKNAMTARYLYEHLFLAHITFKTGSGEFYELVRSKTRSGEEVEVIPTVRPYDDPGPGCFFYRFRKIHSTIVHKTHMVFPLDRQLYDRIYELFIVPDWLEKPHMVSYELQVAGNPFKAFEQIPAKSRYQFLLDNIHYIIMTFIRGPVCKGQVALNVVRDHFWLLFMDPVYDLSVQNPGFLKTYGSLLEMPALEEDNWKLAKNVVFKKTYRKKSSKFVAERKNFYSSHYRYREVGTEAIWKGGRKGDSPMLTVFRHFDSASVHKGPVGDLPRTVWVMDFPLVERIYYSLVAGFNVYGNALHQVATRVYMDELRQEGETYFLDFMPQSKRQEMMTDWYGGMDLSGVNLNYTPSDLKAGYDFMTSDPKREFVEELVDHEFMPATEMAFDKNYRRAGEEYPDLPDTYTSADDYITGFLAVTKPGTSFFKKVADHGANLAYVRIMVDEDKTNDIYLTMVINRWHDDVTTLFEEDDKLDPAKDNVTFVKGFIGSYPNYFFQVKLGELNDFLRMLRDFDGSHKDMVALDHFGVNRAEPKFWEVYDTFQARFLADEPELGGLFDLNRYYHEARVTAVQDQ